MEKTSRRAFIAASTAACVGTVLRGQAKPGGGGETKHTSGGLTSEPEGPLFHRLKFEGAKAEPGQAVHVRQAGVQMVPVVGGKYNVWTKRVGAGGTKVLAVHGGPGGNHEYMECLEDFLPQGGYELYYYDQLGCGNSDHPDDASLWTVERYLKEVEEVRAGLGLTDFVFYGQSWGGMLAQEYAINFPKHLKAVVISNMTASIASYEKHLGELRAALPAEIQAVMDKYESQGKYDAPEYQDILFNQVYRRHLCRLEPWPEPLSRGFAHLNEKIYNQMQGPSEFTVTGNFKGWNRWDDLHKIVAPTLLIVGRHDTMSAEDIQKMGTLIPRSRVVVCENGSHACFFDDQEAYFAALLQFLREVDRGTFPKAKG